MRPLLKILVSRSMCPFEIFLQSVFPACKALERENILWKVYVGMLLAFSMDGMSVAGAEAARDMFLWGLGKLCRPPGGAVSAEVIMPSPPCSGSAPGTVIGLPCCTA